MIRSSFYVPEYTAHHNCLLFWEQKGDQHNIWQVVLMPCLISVYQVLQQEKLRPDFKIKGPSGDFHISQ